MIRFIPMFIVGILCNFFVAMVVAKLPLVAFAGMVLCKEYHYCEADLLVLVQSVEHY